MVCALFSHTYHVIHHVMSCDMTPWLPYYIIMTWYFPALFMCNKSKRKKRNINNNLAILPSHNIYIILCRNLLLIIHVWKGLGIYKRGEVTMSPSYTNSRHWATALYVDSGICRSFNGRFKVVRIHNYVRDYRIRIYYTMLRCYY